MRYLFISLIIMAILFPAIALSWTGEVKEVEDGDMLDVYRRHDKEITIRLYGVDCPKNDKSYCDRLAQC